MIEISSFTMAEACAHFDRVARAVDEQGTAVIVRNGVPRYRIIEISPSEESAEAAEDEVMAVSARLIRQNREAYEELAK